MSEQNQLAINPYVAGGVGAVAGAGIGLTQLGSPLHSVKSEFDGATNLLELDQDKFESIKPADDAAAEVRNNYDTFKKGREEIATAEKTHNETLAKDVEDYLRTNDTANYKPEADFEYKFKNADDIEVTKKISDLEADVNAAKSDADVIEAVDEDAEVKAAKEAAERETDATKKANLEKKHTELRDKKLAEQDKVKKAQELVDKAKAERAKGMNERIAELAKDQNANTPIAKLAKRIKDGFDKKAKIKDMIDATDSKYAGAFDKIKGILPKVKWKAAAAYGAALGALGVALSYIIGPKNDVPTDVA